MFKESVMAVCHRISGQLIKTGTNFLFKVTNCCHCFRNIHTMNFVCVYVFLLQLTLLIALDLKLFTLTSVGVETWLLSRIGCSDLHQRNG